MTWSDERTARARLTGLLPTRTVARQWADRVGPVAAARILMDEDHFGELPFAYHQRWYDPDSEFGRPDLMAEDNDLDFIIPGDRAWPRWLDAMREEAPPGLWVRSSDLLDGRHGGDQPLTPPLSVSVVGSRASTAYGEQVAMSTARNLAAGGWGVVSGAAYGIDQAAHRGALSMEGGRTIAVLACGVDVAYPRTAQNLLDQISGRGAVVSEYWPGTQPSRERFLDRNRLIAGMTGGTLLVEASPRSGSMSTARWTHRLGRTLMAVPGPVTSAHSQGCHEAIVSLGAHLVADAEDVLSCMAGER